MNFLTEEILKGTDWRAVERAVARVMSHCGWHDVQVVGRTGDCGGDVIGVRSEDGKRKVYVIQVKAVTGGEYVGQSAVSEAIEALHVYGGDVAVVCTNGDFTASTRGRRDELRAAGYDIRLWNGEFLQGLLNSWPEYHHARFQELRPYQNDIVNACLDGHSAGGKRALFIVATGLGKTVIAAETLSRLFRRGLKRGLVLCHQQDLALQLERSFWRQISKHVPTRVFFDGEPPKPIDGINFGLYQTFTGYLNSVKPDDYDVVIVDEAHHAIAAGFRRCINYMQPRFLIGMTATPWRGDAQSINDLFGGPIAQVSLVDGMQMGYLAQVDYQIYCDTVDWKHIPDLTHGAMSVSDLNRRLFLPQRDEAVIAELLKGCKQVKDPRMMVFCASVEHGRRFAALMTSISGMTCRPLSGIDRRERHKTLMEFSSGKIPAVTAVDVLNEGIDVPEINIIAFLRATHSRRIFVQQLGRGLRITDSKKKVLVYDFVTDIRRIAEVLQMDREARRPSSKYCVLTFPEGLVSFKDAEIEAFVSQWLKDVADLADSDDAHVLHFPETIAEKAC